MLKQEITYDDFDDVTRTATLHFNISKSELADNLHLQPRLEKMSETFAGPPRTLNKDEVRDILELVKTFMKLAYGIRSEDGKRFRKNPEIWADFQDSAEYDAFLMSLFEDPEKAVNFMINIMPKDLIAQVRSDQAAAGITTTPEIATAPPVLASVPETPAEPVTDGSAPVTEVDIDALLAEHAASEQPAEEPKIEIKKSQVEFLRQRLSPEQLAQHLQDKVVVD